MTEEITSQTPFEENVDDLQAIFPDDDGDILVWYCPTCDQDSSRPEYCEHCGEGQLEPIYD